ncbi:ZP domain-containing protein-like isoform X1 [Acropora millepora]|uniref:ZP domain-containing protein-like isoform X1 n=1 Tax=Acropora millepora TaxID=45264 RepID=UPI001CF0E8FA|nr:ZP domain-containing protein-like isoform X1 [Acropora millepora]
MFLLFWEIFVFLFRLVASNSDADPCVSYQELRDSHRSQFYTILPSDFPNCDKNLKSAWYRFRGKAGLNMPQKCVNLNSCGTHSPGWFEGSLPSVPGEISSGKACFNWIGDCCYFVNSVRVKNCDGFFIYELSPTPLCDLQYCGDGVADQDCTADNNDVILNGSLPGSLVSPRFSHSTSLQCTWRLVAPPGMILSLTLSNISLSSNNYIVFLDGLQDSSKELARVTENASGVIRLHSGARYLLIKFVAKGSHNGTVFRLEYRSVYPATKETMTTATTAKQVKSSMEVKCDENAMNVVLLLGSKLEYIPESVGLNDASCKPSFQNRTHIVVKCSLDACGTTSHESEDGQMIVYDNAIHLDVKSKGNIGSSLTRDHQAVFEFQCRFKKRKVLSALQFKASKRVIVTDMESFGNFTYEMKMFKSGRFREHYTEYPVGPIDVGSQIFLQVTVRSNVSELVVLPEECKATPSSYYDDDVHYTFIEDGCSKDNTLQYNYTLSAVQRFSLSAFKFKFDKSSEVFLHCKVKACLSSDEKSRCSKGCPFGRRKKRESLFETDRYLAIGPIILSPSKHEQLSKKTGNKTPATTADDTYAFAVVAGVLGFIVLLLLAALLSICKSRETPKANGANIALIRKEQPE